MAPVRDTLFDSYSLYSAQLISCDIYYAHVLSNANLKPVLCSLWNCEIEVKVIRFLTVQLETIKSITRIVQIFIQFQQQAFDLKVVSWTV